MPGGAPGTGAPRGERNGSYKHDLYTCEAMEERRLLQGLLADGRKGLLVAGV